MTVAQIQSDHWTYVKNKNSEYKINIFCVKNSFSAFGHRLKIQLNTLLVELAVTRLVALRKCRDTLPTLSIWSLLLIYLNVVLIFSSNIFLIWAWSSVCVFQYFRFICFFCNCVILHPEKHVPTIPVVPLLLCLLVIQCLILSYGFIFDFV